jgi:hypothetical protein
LGRGNHECAWHHFAFGFAILGSNPAEFERFHTRTILLPVYGLFCGLCGWLGVKSWRRLWRSGRNLAERAIYDEGVRGFGALMLIGFPLLMGAWLSIAESGANDPNAWRLVLACVFVLFPVGLPLFLWAGFIWGSLRADRLTRDTRATVNEFVDGLPPAL